MNPNFYSQKFTVIDSANMLPVLRCSTDLLVAASPRLTRHAWHREIIKCVALPVL